MLQVTFRNLLPSEELVGAANEAYRDVCEAQGGPRATRCYVTVSADSSPDAQRDWVRVHVELHHAGGATSRVRAEGAYAPLAVRSSVRAAAPFHLGPKPIRMHCGGYERRVIAAGTGSAGRA